MLRIPLYLTLLKHVFKHHQEDFLLLTIYDILLLFVQSFLGWRECIIVIILLIEKSCTEAIYSQLLER